MIRRLLCPGLLETGPVNDAVAAVRDGIVNLFVVKGPGGLICVNAGWRPASVARGFESLGVRIGEVATLLLTHLHWDHARCAPLFGRAEIFVGARELPPLLMRGRLGQQKLQRVEDGQTLSLGGLTVHIVATPGHTAGSVSYLVNNKWLFTGDALRFRRGAAVPFLDCFNRDHRAVRQSLQKLARIKHIACILTSHSGVSDNSEGSFAAWRQVEDRLSGESVGP